MGEAKRPRPAAEPAAGEAEAAVRKNSPAGTPHAQPPGEVGGPKGPEPTRYGDWEKGGRCIDF